MAHPHDTPRITVIGAGMAGSDAAFAAAELGVQVELFEMRPTKQTPAHRTGSFAELVCSNSFGGEGESNAKGLLQREMLAAGGLVMTTASRTRVPAGGALAVDRDAFGAEVTAALKDHPNITVHAEEVRRLPEGVVVLASGPLTSDALAEGVRETVGGAFLGFYDAAAPVIDVDSVDMTVAYRKGRYGQAADYLNLPFNKEQYERWFEALSRARQHTPHDWENLEFFEGCMPIEELARRGVDTPRFGPLKPVGLEHPETGERPYAVAQLRQEDVRGQMWSLVGFQTGLKWGDQRAAKRRGGAVRRHAPQHLLERAEVADPGAEPARAPEPLRGGRAGRDGGVPRVLGDGLARRDERRAPSSRSGPRAAPRNLDAGRLGALLGDRQPRGLPADERQLEPRADAREAQGRGQERAADAGVCPRAGRLSGVAGNGVAAPRSC
jgi:hypothetical protein